MIEEDDTLGRIFDARLVAFSFSIFPHRDLPAAAAAAIFALRRSYMDGKTIVLDGEVGDDREAAAVVSFPPLNSCCPRFTRSASDGPPTPPSFLSPWSAASISGVTTMGADGEVVAVTVAVGFDDDVCFEVVSLDALFDSAVPHRDLPAAAAAATFCVSFAVQISAR